MVLQYPLNQRDAVFQHCGRYQRSSSKSSTVSEHFPISICFRNRLEVKSTRLDVHEQILNSYFRALCSKCNIQSSGGGVCLIFFFSIAVFRPPPLRFPPPMAAMHPSFSILLTLLFSTYVSFAWNEDQETGKTSFWAAKLTYTNK